MVQVVRPKRFDGAARERRNAKRRADAKTELYRRTRGMFCIGFEPETMWDATDWSGNADNDNRAQ